MIEHSEAGVGPAGQMAPPDSTWGGDVAVAIDTFLTDHPGGTERLIPLLHFLQERLGHVPFDVQELVALRLGLSPIQVYSVLSFYSFFTLTPRGRFPLKVCMGTACFVRHATRLIETLQETLKIDMGESTDDKLFSLEQVRCLGACGLAPAMMVGNDVYGNLDAKQVRRLVTQLRARGRREGAATGGEATRG
jgi:NADH-quinone oxidoreductase subunit E/NADP-reducing hydrogenase subunit HndA